LTANVLRTFTIKRDSKETYSNFHPGDEVVELEFHCRDTGVGMSSEVMNDLFQPFKQADTSTTRIFGGTGLGLAITRNLVEVMHGDITVQSTENVGTEFIWYILSK
jgi:two-component system sensor histidine kinase/response regulator